MTVKLISRLGLIYILSNEGMFNVKITSNYQGKPVSIEVQSSIDELTKSWFKWIDGAYIQEAFPYLSADEREFLMTGITKKEWERIFGN